MEKKSEDFSMADAMRIAQSPVGQQLLETLKRSDTGELKKAMDQASAGNFAQAKKELSAIMASPEIKRLLEQLGG